VVEEYVEKRVLLTVKNILIANFKLLMGHAIYADVMGKADASNSELVEGTVTRAQQMGVQAACFGGRLGPQTQGRPRRQQNMI